MVKVCLYILFLSLVSCSHLKRDPSSVKLKPFPKNVNKVIEFYKGLVVDNDVVFLGEAHGIKYVNRAIYEIVPELIKSKTIDIYMSESVAAEDMKLVNDYFQDKLTDEELFKVLKSKLNWFKNHYVRELLKSIKRLKKENYKIKFCGIDVIAGEGNRAKDFKVRFSNLRPELQDKILKISSKSLDELSELGDLYDREAMMAQNISNCLEDGKKSLVRVGRSHGVSSKWSDPEDKTWVATSKYLSVLQPNKKQVATALHHSTVESGPSGPDSNFVKKFIQDSYRIFANSEFTDSMRSVLKHEVDGVDYKYHEFMDYWVFGPESPYSVED